MVSRSIRLRHWDIVFYFSSDSDKFGRIRAALLWADAPDSILRQVSDNLSAGRLNEGFCYSNPRERKTVISIGRTSSGPEFLDTVVHEITHVTQDIASTDGIDPFGEEFAYLAGDISHSISDVVCEMSCPKCHDSL